MFRCVIEVCMIDVWVISKWTNVHWCHHSGKFRFCSGYIPMQIFNTLNLSGDHCSKEIFSVSLSLEACIMLQWLDPHFRQGFSHCPTTCNQIFPMWRRLPPNPTWWVGSTYKGCKWGQQFLVTEMPLLPPDLFKDLQWSTSNMNPNLWSFLPLSQDISRYMKSKSITNGSS